MKKILLIVIIILFIIIISIYIKGRINIEISNYNFKTNKVSKDYKIVLISDFHNYNRVDKIVSKINEINPDYILMSGDMLGDNEKYDNFILLCNKLNKYKLYYIFGNHENYYTYDNTTFLNKYVSEINKIVNLTLLNEKMITIEDINLYGINPNNDYYYETDSLDNSYIEKYFNVDESKYNILLSHNPLFDKLYSDCKFDLVVSGHVHGGIVRLPLIGGLLSPEYKFFPKYTKGVYNFGNTNLIVSTGLTYNSVSNLRFLNDSEIVVINIQK